MAKRKKTKRAKTTKTTKASKKRTTRRRRTGGGRSAGGSGGGAVPQDVMSNLRAALQGLNAQRAQIDKQIAALEGALAAMGGGAPAMSPSVFRAAGRPAAARVATGGSRYRSGSLKEHIEAVLAASGGTMAVKDITDGVIASGYSTRNKTLAKSVGIALTEMPNVEKIGRGKFRLK